MLVATMSVDTAAMIANIPVDYKDAFGVADHKYVTPLQYVTLLSCVSTHGAGCELRFESRPVYRATIQAVTDKVRAAHVWVDQWDTLFWIMMIAYAAMLVQCTAVVMVFRRIPQYPVVTKHSRRGCQSFALCAWCSIIGLVGLCVLTWICHTGNKLAARELVQIPGGLGYVDMIQPSVLPCVGEPQCTIQWTEEGFNALKSVIVLLTTLASKIHSVDILVLSLCQLVTSAVTCKVVAMDVRRIERILEPDEEIAGVRSR